jgi:competence protein ComGC
MQKNHRWLILEFVIVIIILSITLWFTFPLFIKTQESETISRLQTAIEQITIALVRDNGHTLQQITNQSSRISASGIVYEKHKFTFQGILSLFPSIRVTDEDLKRPLFLTLVRDKRDTSSNTILFFSIHTPILKDVSRPEHIEDAIFYRNLNDVYMNEAPFTLDLQKGKPCIGIPKKTLLYNKIDREGLLYCDSSQMGCQIIYE